jgi:hypothetical protein
MCLLQLNYGDATNIVLFQKYNNNKKNKEKTRKQVPYRLLGAICGLSQIQPTKPPLPPSPP